VRSGEGDAEHPPADSDRAEYARHAGGAVQRRSTRGARPRSQESAAGGGRQSARCEPSPPAGNDRGVRRIPDADRQAGQPGRVERNHHVAAQDVRNARQIASYKDALDRAVDLARAYIASRDERPVWPTASLDDLRAAIGGPLADDPIAPDRVIESLARAADPGLVTTTGPRYFGFVTGGALPATVAAEWLTSAWDQNAGLYVMSPAASIV